MKMEDLGKKEKMAGREIYSHIAWADKMGTVVKGAKIETTTTYIGHVRKELPKLLREKVGGGYTDWTTFLQAIWDIDINYIRDGADIWKKEQDKQEALKKRVQMLGKVSASPTAPLRHQMMTFSIGNPATGAMQPPWQVITTPANKFHLQAPQEDVGTCFKPLSQPTHRPTTQDPQQQLQTEQLCSCTSKNTHTTQTQNQAG